jgi:hypothetical protein
MVNMLNMWHIKTHDIVIYCLTIKTIGDAILKFSFSNQSFLLPFIRVIFVQL